MLGSFIRAEGYWALDFLRGAPVKRRYKHLSQLRRDQRPNSMALNSLLEHALKTVPVYRSIFQARIEKFPVVNKNVYRADYDSFRSSEFIDEAVLYSVYTSGSTGTPFRALQDFEKLNWHRAGLISINDSIGWKLGERFVFIRVWGSDHKVSRLARWMKNVIPVDALHFDEPAMEQLRISLKKHADVGIMLGYASALQKFANYVIAQGDTPDQYHLRFIIADSDCLTDSSRQMLKKAFNCSVYDRYANNENGILALCTSDTGDFEVNYPEYYMELLSLDSDEHVKPGELGRIVITDLYNKAFPFIRYDTGDVGVASRMYGNQVMSLARLDGRSSSILLTTDGRTLGETSIQTFFKSIMNIEYFQIIQTARSSYTFRMVGSGKIDETSVHEAMQRCFGNDAQVAIEYVDRIQQTTSGKIRVVVNEMEKK